MKLITKPDGTEVFLEEPKGVSPTLQERIRCLELNQDKMAEVINSWSLVMNTLIANSMQIYPQYDTKYSDSVIDIRAPKAITHSTSIILVLPCQTLSPKAGEDFITKAILRVHCGNKTPIELTIAKEDYNGNIINLQAGDIVSNRLCVFRVDPTIKNRVILCHSLSFDSLGVNKLICNEAIFTTFPKISMGNGSYETVLSSKSSMQLQKELDDRYQQKIVFGTESPDEFIKNNYLEPGQIYIQQGD